MKIDDFNQDISSWNVTNVANFTNFLSYADLFSTTNYDALLIAWDALNLTDNLTFGAHYYVKYTGCSAAATARSNIITNDSWTIYDTDVSAPTMAITSAEVSDGASSNDSTLAMTFTSSEATSNFVVGDISVSGGALSSFNATSSTVYTAIFTPSGDGAKTIDVAGGAFTDSSSNNNIAATQFNWTYDSAVPTLSSALPANNATGIAVSANIVLNFSEVVDRESGNITIKRTSDNATIETIAVTDSKITGSGTTQITINPATTLASLTEYYVLIDASGFDDPSSNSYAGISSTTALSFTTAGACNVSGAITKAKLTTAATNGDDITACNVSSLTDLSSVFLNITGFNQNIGSWDTSNVTTMYKMFEGATSFNQDVSGWDVSDVTNMEGMFDTATAFNNGGAALDWSNTGSVTTMKKMFDHATSFNQDVSPWNVSSVNNMEYMFYYASVFNNGDSGNNGNAALDWSNTSSVLNMRYLFHYAVEFNQAVSSLNVSKVTNMQNMFAYATRFNNGDTGNNANAAMTWSDTSKVTNMNSMFNTAINFNQDISPWNVSSVTNMSYMFYEAAIFNNGGVALDWVDLNDLVYAYSMFAQARNFNQSVSTWQLGSLLTVK